MIHVICYYVNIEYILVMFAVVTQIVVQNLLQSYTNKILKRTLFNKTRQYNVDMFDPIIFFKCRAKQLKTTEQK